jgi:hypothetical protein
VRGVTFSSCLRALIGFMLLPTHFGLGELRGSYLDSAYVVIYQQKGSARPFINRSSAHEGMNMFKKYLEAVPVR